LKVSDNEAMKIWEGILIAPWIYLLITAFLGMAVGRLLKAANKDLPEDPLLRGRRDATMRILPWAAPGEEVEEWKALHAGLRSAGANRR
jgi:hypothetical protein